MALVGCCAWFHGPILAPWRRRSARQPITAVRSTNHQTIRNQGLSYPNSSILVVGPPHDPGEVFRADRRVRKSPNQRRTTLAIRPLESVLRFRHSGGAHSRIGVRFPLREPGAAGSDAALLAPGNLRTDQAPKLHYRLVPRPGILSNDQLVSDALDFTRGERSAFPSRQHSTDVRIHDGVGLLECEDSHRPSCVRSDSGKR